MIVKKVAGVIFIVGSGILLLAVIGLLKDLLTAMVGFFMMITGQLDAAGAGEVTGTLLYWLLHFTLMIWFWSTGRRWTKKHE